MATIANLTVALNADVSGFTGTMASATRGITAFKKAGQGVYAATRTDLENYQAGLKRIEALYRGGQLSAETYGRAISKLRTEFNGTAANADQLRAAGVKVFQQMMTPAEAYRAKLADLNRLLKAGAINQQTFNRAQSAALGVLNAPHVAARAADAADQARKQAAAAALLKGQGAAVFDSTRTAAEQYSTKLTELNRLLKAGAISQNTHARAVAAAKATYVSAASSVKMLTDNASRFEVAQAAVNSGLAKLNGIRLGGGTMLAAFLGVGAAKHSIGLAADFQATSISMEVMMKDAKASKALIENLYQYAAKTPFEFPDVTAASKQLLGFGVAAKDIMPTIKNLGELSSGLDIPLSDLANLFGRNRNQAHIFSRDINEFTSRGIPIIQQLAKQFDTTSGGVMKLVEAGKVGFPDVEKAISAMTGAGGQFEGLTDRLSTSMKGLASTAKDDLNTALREVGNTIGAVLLPMISQAAKDIAALTVAMRGVGETDFGKSLASNDARIARKNATNTAADTGEQIRRNIAEQQDVLKQHAAVAKRMEGRSAFNPVDLAALPGESQLLSNLSRRLNQLAKERAALERLRNTQRGPSPVTLSGAATAKGVRAVTDALGSGQKGIEAMGKGLSGIFNKTTARAFKNEIKDTFKTLEKSGKLLSDLRTQGDTFGMNARQVAIYKAQLDQVPEAILKIARANAKRVADMEAERRMRERDAQRTKEATENFSSLKEKTRGPAEEFKKSLEDIKKLEDAGFGSTPAQKAILDKARGQAAADFFSHDKTNAGNTNNPGLVAGSSAFYSAINKSINKPDKQKRMEDAVKRIADAQKRREQIERDQLAALKKLKVANF